MIKYNIVVCSYDKMLVNVAAYVIPGVCGVIVCGVCVCVCVCGVVCVCVCVCVCVVRCWHCYIVFYQFNNS